MNLFTGFIYMMALAISCKKALPGRPVIFKVVADSSTYTAGGSPKFTFTGNPDIITFYSGQWGQRYEYRNRVRDTSGDTWISFSSTINRNGTSGKLLLLLSADFNGDTAQINDANWIDLSDRVNWATGSMPAASGVIDLNFYKSSGKPVWIAFRYDAIAGVTQKKWTVANCSIVHRLPNDTAYTLANFTVTVPTFSLGVPSLIASPGWVAVYGNKNSGMGGDKWMPAVSTTSTVSFAVSGATAANGALASRQWLVTGPIDLNRVLKDVPSAVVKNITANAENLTPAFNYKYPAAGIFNAVFIGQNVNADNENSLVRELKIMIR